MKRGKSAENRADSEISFHSYPASFSTNLSPIANLVIRHSPVRKTALPQTTDTFAYPLFRIFNERGRSHKAYFYFLIPAHLAHLTTGLNKQIYIQVSVARVVVRDREHAEQMWPVISGGSLVRRPCVRWGLRKSHHTSCGRSSAPHCLLVRFFDHCQRGREECGRDIVECAGSWHIWEYPEYDADS